MSTRDKIAIIFISGSAGELDWILPILDFLLKKGFNLKIIFLTRHALKSVEENSMCNNFIKQENSKIELIFSGGYFSEKIERLGYLSYRLFLKLKLNKIPGIKDIYTIYDKCLKSLFMRRLPSDMLHFKNETYLVISEFPSLRRPRDFWIKTEFRQSIFFYCPHSPHIYTEDLDKEYKEPDLLDFNQKSFLLLGHPGDYYAINDGRELAAPALQKVFIGHPKYSDTWLHNFQDAVKDFHSASSTRDKTNILVISRGSGSYLDEESHNNLVETIIRVIHDQIPNYNLLVKKHPREISSHWHNIEDNYSSVKIVNDHILQLATRVDFVISLWSSGAMDCFSLGLPVIEYWDPNKHSKQQVPDGAGYSTIYRKLGIVLPANDEEQLGAAISSLVSPSCKMSVNEPHSFFSEILTRSNQWDKTIEKILLSHNLINN